MAEKTADQKKIAELEAENSELKKLIDNQNNVIKDLKNQYEELSNTPNMDLATLENYVKKNNWNPEKPILVKDIIEIVDRIKYPDRWDS